MKLYDTTGAPNPRRVRMFMAEKGVECEKVELNIVKGENLTEEFLVILNRLQTGMFRIGILRETTRIKTPSIPLTFTMHHDLGQNLQPEISGGQRCCKQPDQQCGEGDQTKWCVMEHGPYPRAGNRPVGRTTSTSANSA